MKCNQRVIVTKRMLHEALLQLLEEKSIDKISITELCDKAGINRATFYRHYNIPRDVLVEMEANFTEDINSRFESIGLTTDAYNYILDVSSYLYENSKLIKMFISNNSEQDLTFMMNDMFRRFLNNKEKYPNLAKMDAENVKLITSYVAGGSYFMLRQWLMEDVPKKPEEVANLLMDFLNYSSMFNAKRK